VNILRIVGVCLLSGCFSGAEDLGAAPRSLAGTQVDGELRTGADDSFVFDRSARQMFDYFLTADSELSREELDGWVRAEVGHRLPPAAAIEAFAAWEAYVGFRGEAAEALAEPVEGTDLAAVEQRLLAAVDEQLGDYAIASEERAQIARGFALGRIARMQGAARERALAELAVENGGSEAEEFLRAREAIAAGDGADVEALRRAHFGAAAAERLAALDERRAAWNRRVAALRGERDALERGFAGSQAELEAAIAALERRAFTPEELRRVHALDRLAR
jgi:lipase chaperone LimK